VTWSPSLSYNLRPPDLLIAQASKLNLGTCILIAKRSDILTRRGIWKLQKAFENCQICDSRVCRSNQKLLLPKVFKRYSCVVYRLCSCQVILINSSLFLRRWEYSVVFWAFSPRNTNTKFLESLNGLYRSPKGTRSVGQPIGLKKFACGIKTRELELISKTVDIKISAWIHLITCRKNAIHARYKISLESSRHPFQRRRLDRQFFFWSSSNRRWNIHYLFLLFTLRYSIFSLLNYLIFPIWKLADYHDLFLDC
jgi:hypothetical protein